MLLAKNDFRNSFFDDLFSISKELNNYFDSDYSYNYSYPLTNIYENDKSYNIVAEIPGVKKEDLKVNITANSISIEGTRESEIKDEGKYSTHRLERSFGSFNRTYALSDKIDTEKVTAEYKNGILNITLLKSEDNKPKSISIKTN